MPNSKTVFILDTNVILHDSNCIYEFAEHDVIIPITVMEELDRFKKGDAVLNYHARQFVRTLDALSGDGMFNGGLRIGPGLGKISIHLEMPFGEALAMNFSPDKPDHHILNIAHHLAGERGEGRAILVTKDVNLRMKAKSIGLLAQDYTTDHVKDVDGLYAGYRTVENLEGALIDNLYEAPHAFPVDALPDKCPSYPNQFYILKNGRKSGLGVYDAEESMVRRVDRISAFGITPRNAGQTFALSALMNPAIPLVTVSGKAGTGKTLLALAAGLGRRKYYRQIFLARPIVPLSNKDLGYLPGDLHQKMDPYMQPLYDNLGVIQNQFVAADTKNKRIRKLLDEEKLVISPLSYIRGRSLAGVYFIVDEAQNLTPHEVKTIITRAGDGTKIVFTGDVHQIDHPYLDSLSNGLSHLIEKMQGQKLYAHVNLEKGERSELAELASNVL